VAEAVEPDHGGSSMDEGPPVAGRASHHSG
jgi:hypothetical protein